MFKKIRSKGSAIILLIAFCAVVAVGYISVYQETQIQQAHAAVPFGPTPEDGSYEPKQNFVEVCKQGCQYDTIQEGMDTIVGGSLFNPSTLLVYPGVYSENVVCADGVTLQSVGLGSVIINPASGIGIDCSVSSSVVKDIAIIMAPTASGAVGYFSDSGGLNVLVNVRISMSSSTPGVTGKLIDATSLLFTTITVDYNMTGTSAGVSTHVPITINGSGDIQSNAFIYNSTIADEDDNVQYIEDNSTGNLNMQGVIFNGNLSHATPSGTADFLKSNFAGTDKEIRGSSIVMSGGGTSTKNAFNIDSGGNSAVLNSTGNTVIFNGTGTNNFSLVDVTDQLMSTADPITGADTFSIGDGFTTFRNSQASSQLVNTSLDVMTINTTDEWHAVQEMESTALQSDIVIKEGLVGSITSFASGGVGITTVTSVAHGLSDGEIVTITGGTAYDGIHTVSNKTDDTFDVQATFGLTGTGTLRRGDSFTIMKKGTYEITWSISFDPTGNNKRFDFATFNGESLLVGSDGSNTFGAGGDTQKISSVSGGEFDVGDVIWVGIKNVTDTSDMSIGNGSAFIKKIS